MKLLNCFLYLFLIAYINANAQFKAEPRWGLQLQGGLLSQLGLGQLTFLDGKYPIYLSPIVAPALYMRTKKGNYHQWGLVGDFLANVKTINTKDSVKLAEEPNAFGSQQPIYHYILTYNNLSPLSIPGKQFYLGFRYEYLKKIRSKQDSRLKNYVAVGAKLSFANISFPMKPTQLVKKFGYSQLGISLGWTIEYQCSPHFLLQLGALIDGTMTIYKFSWFDNPAVPANPETWDNLSGLSATLRLNVLYNFGKMPMP